MTADSENDPIPNEFRGKAPQQKIPGIRLECGIVGMGATFLLTYFAGMLFWIIYNEKGSSLVYILLDSLAIPATIALVMSFLGGAVGRMVSGFREAPFAALVGGLAFIAAFGTWFFLLNDYSFGAFRQNAQTILASGAMGALVGGIVSIYRRSRTVLERKSMWPQFFLSELLLGFFLIAVLFASWTDFVRQLH